MKFTIRFADQIVGAFIILALGILIFVIFMLGSNQRWFAKDYLYKAYFNSGVGISQNMPLQYKGFTIGRIKSIELSSDDRVEVNFTIFDIYIDRVREGSMVEVLVSPIGLGNQFMFYPGLGTGQIPEGEAIPVVNSPEARDLIAAGLAIQPERDDGINNIMNRVNSVLASLDASLADVQGALEGTDRTTLGRTLGNVETATSGLSRMPSDITRKLDQVVAELDPILKDLQGFSDKLSDPSGSVMSILDSEGPVYTDLVASLDSITGTLRNLERTSQFLPSQFTTVLSQVQSALQSAQDVLVALTNNPLLQGGVPVHRETYPGGARPRDLEF